MASVSVIIPTYNRAHFIGDAIASVLSQTRRVDEILVVDDGSTDGTERLLDPYKNEVRYFRQQNSGPAAARNLGLRHCSGEFAAFLDSDDLWVPNKTELQLRFFEQHPEVDLSFGNMANFAVGAPNEQPEIKSPKIYHHLRQHSSNVERMFECLLEENVIPTPTVMLRTACISRIGYFNEGLRTSEDYEYWLRAAHLCRFGFVDAVLLLRRRHAGNLINEFVTRLSNRALVLTANRRTPSGQRHSRLIDEKLSEIFYDLGSYHLKRGKFRAALGALKKSSHTPKGRLVWGIKYGLARLLSRLG